MNAQPVASQGQFVLLNSRPAVAADANDHGGRDSSRNVPARAATAIASTASPNTLPAGANGSSNGSRSWASTVNHTRTASAARAKRRSQPRTVEAGTPNTDADRR